MTGLNVSLDPESVKELITGAIFEQIGQEGRDALVRQALTALTMAEKDRYGQPMPTPLQIAFTNAVTAAAHKVVMETLRDDPAIEVAIADLLGPLRQAAIDRQWDGLPEALGSAFAAWIAKKEERY